MRKLIHLLFVLVFLTACNTSGNTEENNTETATTENVASTENSEQEEVRVGEWLSKGEEISPEGAIDIEAFKTKIEGQTEINTKLETKIMSCCQKKGCWMKVDLGDGEEMRVTFKDYGFFVPLDATGMDVIMEGKAYYDTTSVEMLQHYAEDAGESPEAIAEITEPKLELAFEATGVLLK